jgi:hypothetical protein
MGARHSFFPLLDCSTAEELLRALSEQLAAYTKQSGAPNAETLAKSETDARLEHSAAKARLAKLEALFGADGTDAERGGIAKRLEEREERVKVLEAQVKAQDPVSAWASIRGRLSALSNAR